MDRNRQSYLALRAVIWFLIALVPTACSTVGCPRTAEAPLVRSIHVEAGDGPAPWGQTIFRDGTLRLEVAGERPHCRSLAANDLEKLRMLVGDGEILAGTEPVQGNAHDEQIQVEIGSHVRVYYALRLPGEILPLLQEIDLLFSRAYGDRYHWELLGPDSGP